MFKFLGWVSLGFCFGFLIIPSLASADEKPSAQKDESISVEKGGPEQKQATKKKKRALEKDAEGTQAPNRFETDLIIKSKYELNGQSLEVDTD